MQPMHIEVAPNRWLAAMHHPPSVTATGRAVLVINPLGQEAMRAHRLLRVLSDRLARQGVHVLRFDFHGCGDSSGDDLDGEMTGWQGDVLAAHAWLSRQPGVEAVAWLGIRLGFAIGWLAASQYLEKDVADNGIFRAPMPDRLVGWDPVVSGRAYLDDLWANHQLAIRRAFSLPTVPDRLLKRQRAEEDLSEAMGFALSPVLVSQIRQLDRQNWEKAPVAEINILLSNGALRWPHAHRASAVPAFNAESSRASGESNSRVHVECVDVDFDWTSEEALNTPLVPDQALRRLIPWLSEARHHG